MAKANRYNLAEVLDRIDAVCPDMRNTDRGLGARLFIKEALRGKAIAREDIHKIGSLGLDSNTLTDDVKQKWFIPLETVKIKGSLVAEYRMKRHEIEAFMNPDLRPQQEARQRDISEALKLQRTMQAYLTGVETLKNDSNPIARARQIARMKLARLVDGDTQADGIYSTHELLTMPLVELPDAANDDTCAANDAE